MATYRYVIADVFTDTALQGNQLAVFTDAREIPEDLLQRLAKEMNYSETVFVYKAEADGQKKKEESLAKLRQAAREVEDAENELVSAEEAFDQAVEQFAEAMEEGTTGAEIVEELTPLPGDFMVEKKGGSGFGYTPLHRILRNLNAQRLIMTGGAIGGCVWATVQDGVALGYDITVARDATYPVNSPDLEALGRWCTVLPTSDILSELIAAPVSR